MSPASVFISYSRKDLKLLLQHVIPPLEALESQGRLRVFIDRRIRSGAEWDKELQRELDQAGAAIAIITNSYLNSKFCMGREWPRILARAQTQAISLYLVCGAPLSNEAVPGEMANLQFAVPVSRPLKELSVTERENACSALADDIARGLSGRSSLQRASPDRVPDLMEHDPAVRLQRATELGREYRSSTDAIARVRCLGQLVNMCVRLKLNNIDIADVCRVFSDNAGRLDTAHAEILNLLEGGLPQHPAHLEDIADVRFDWMLMVKGYSRLLQGIRLSESHWEEATNVLEQLREVGILNDCPLRHYALGMAYRKLNRSRVDLENAESELCAAANLLNYEVKDAKVCTICPVGCSKGRLLPQIERGLGVVNRLTEREDQARAHFDAARELARIVGSESLIADIAYSAGYFYFEMAAKKIDSAPAATLLAYFSRAREDLENAIKNRYSWSAPKARLLIVKQLIEELSSGSISSRLRDELRPQYVHLWHEIVPGRGLEPDLTRVLSGLGAIVFGAHKPTEEEVWLALLALADKHFMAKGPINCHLFDISCVLRAPGTHDQRVPSLLKEVSSWEFKTKDEQDAALKNYLQGSRTQAHA